MPYEGYLLEATLPMRWDAIPLGGIWVLVDGNGREVHGYRFATKAEAEKAIALAVEAHERTIAWAESEREG